MANTRLTWQNVAAPDFSGAAYAQRLAADSFDRAVGRIGEGLTQFDETRKNAGDAAIMQNMMRYQDADALQAAIASGALTQGVDPAAIRASTLLKAHSQVGNLLDLSKERQALSTSKQTYDFNEQMNPLNIARNSQLNTETAHNYARQLENEARTDKARDGAEAAGRSYAAAQQAGKFATQADAVAWGNAQDLNTAEGRFAYDMIRQLYPDAYKVVEPLSLSTGLNTPSSAADAAKGVVGSSLAPTTNMTKYAVGVDLTNYMGAGGKKLTGNDAIFAGATHWQESGNGRAKTDTANSHDVIGEMQVQGKTFEGMKDLGLIPRNWDFKNPQNSKDAGTIWTQYLMQKHGGRMDRAAAEYYSGPNAVNADGTINRDRRDLKNPDAPTVGQYVDQVMQRAAALSGQSVGGATPTAPVTAAALAPTAAATADIPSRTELAMRGNQAAMAIGQSANQANATTGRLLLEAQNKSLTGSANVQLQPVVNRLTGEGGQFAGMPKQHVEKMLREVGQQIGSGDNYEVPAVLLAGMGTVEKTAGIRRYIPGADDPGRYFDTAQVQEMVKQFKANGGTKAYTDLAAADIATSQANSQASNVASMDALRTQLADLKTLAARGNRAAAAQVPLVEAALSATMLSSNTESRSLAQRLGPTPTVPTQAPASTAPAPTTAPAPAPAPVSYRDFVDNSPAAARERRATAQAEQDARDAEARQQEVKRKGEVMQQVIRVSPDSIRRMTPHEARSMMENSEVFNRLPRASQRMLERQASL